MSVLAMALVLVISACSSGDDAPEVTGAAADTAIAGSSMAYTNATDAAPLYVLLQNGVEKAATTTGVALKTYDNALDPSKVSSNARLIAQSKPDYVASYNPVAGIYPSIEKIYEDAGIPCIAVNTPSVTGDQPGYCSWLNLSNPQLCTDTAKAVGKAAQEKGWNGDNTTVLLVNAPSFGEQINNCNSYFYKEITNWVPGLQAINDVSDLKVTTTQLGDSMIQVDGKAQRGPSFDSVKNALAGVPSSKNLIVYTVADDSALGAWQAVEQAGRGPRSLVAGIGGTKEALEQLRTNPSWVAEGDLFFGHWGQFMMAMAAAKKADQQLPFQTIAPEAVLTKDLTLPDTIVAPIADYYRDGETDAYQLPPLIPVAEGETVFGRQTVGNDYLATTGVLQLFNNVKDLK
ncbi:sugar ABC transporter substrate-binding protein [Gordonia sp. C13]|uniref:sugar ABC transporter substrate-binding protein n=1 Tax=Gordonia sp. C13 TaxID=2935078 RepID=UPI00200A636B|nr:substrate-binding domain-containing protein [Gordonia sp. C13]MCK8615509.1 substrate-binding domain-containing protein [Gordonia sp. C13]